jgi:formate dehydrogenase subunit beta
MVMKTLLPVENGEVLPALRGLLRRLFESGLVEGLFVPMQADGGAVQPALVTDPVHLERADPLAPVMPINAARAASFLTGKRAPAKLGLVLRPCELRALVELVKLQQASLENVILIGSDCPGTFELVDYLDKARAGGFDLPAYLATTREGLAPELEGMTLRTACRMCVQPAPENADIVLHLFGVDAQQGLPLTLNAEIAAALGLAEASAGEADGRQEVVERLVAGRRQVRQAELAGMRSRLASAEGLSGVFAACIRCHNCMTACPICYCKTCLFKTAAFDHPPEYYLAAARRKGGLRLPGDTLLFHLTRLNHMSVSCVSCGMCTSACPAEIPVGTLFSAVGAQVQEAFGYLPGRDVGEPLPLVTFQANEWTEVGETVQNRSSA